LKQLLETCKHESLLSKNFKAFGNIEAFQSFAELLTKELLLL
jgi:hypothetical protein